MEKIYEAGCRATVMGIQTGNENIRERVFNRRISNSRLIEHAWWLHDKKDLVSQHDILGFNPFETEETLRETFDFFCQLPPLRLLIVFRLKFFPESPLGRLYERERPVGLSDDYHRTWIYLWHMAARGRNFRAAAQFIVKNSGGSTPLNQMELLKGIYEGTVKEINVNT